MLKRLHISNFALIEGVKVNFPVNLCVVTGETGAGKSIFLEALSLVLGARADVGVLQDKTKKCIVEAEFFLGNYNLEEFFKTNELDFDTTTILRREINSEGKSRAFINDSPVVLTILKQLGEQLVDIHSQHETLMLNQSSFQFDVIDSVANTALLVSNYRKQFQNYNQKKKILAGLEEQELQAKKDLDYYQFLFNELEEITLAPGDLKSLEEKSASLENAEFIKSNLLKSANAISDGDVNLLSGLTTIKQQLNVLAKFGDTYKTLGERANSLYIELKELAGDIEDTENNVVFDPKKLEEVNSKLDKLNRLFKKHNAKSEEELIAIKQNIEEKLNQFGSLETEIEKVKKEITAIQKEVVQLANEISKKRKSGIPAFEKEVKSILNDLSMPNANFKIELETLPEFGLNGFDTIHFLFSANKGGDFKPLHKVASGGELSRLMLSIKSIMASKKALPTIIFDEIDTGVSGDVADKIGHILMRMSEKMQVISITHLPQIASKGKFHLFVYKNDEQAKTISHIKELNKDERVVEIAKMLSTGNPTASAIKNAKDLLNAN